MNFDSQNYIYSISLPKIGMIISLTSREYKTHIINKIQNVRYVVFLTCYNQLFFN